MPPVAEPPTKPVPMSTIAHEILEASGIDSSEAVFTRITGGVSSSTHAAHLPGRGVIIKQALAQLDVAQEWTANPNRVVAEAEGLAWFNRITPDHVPAPIAVVERLHSLVLPMAPQPSPDLRSVVLENPQDFKPEWPKILGKLLALWHAADHRPALGSSLDDTSRLLDLRVNPFYLDMAHTWPEHASAIEALAEELLSVRTAVVHGDFTPKNVLCLPEGNLWVVDTEVCHIGNPVIDTASMVAHLVLKALHYRNDSATAHALTCARADFLGELSASSTPPRLDAHVGVFLAVRVAGRAPVSYLNEPTRHIVSTMARALVEGAPLEEECQRWLT